MKETRKGALRAAIYARVSTSHHDQNPEVQIQHLRSYCEARQWMIKHEIIDHGYTGSNDRRPGLRNLLQLVRVREVDVVVVVKLDRLFRSLKHLVVTLEEFEALGVTFVATKDAIDWSTPAGRFFCQVLGSLAELEKSILVERTMMGLDHARSRGKRLGRPSLNLTQKVRELRAKGKTYRQIQSLLKISPGTVRNCLKDPAQ